MRRPNLEAPLNALATRVVFEKERAVAVQYLQAGGEHNAVTAREIILAGGAVNSPHCRCCRASRLLMSFDPWVYRSLPIFPASVRIFRTRSVSVAYECKRRFRS